MVREHLACSEREVFTVGRVTNAYIGASLRYHCNSEWVTVIAIGNSCRVLELVTISFNFAEELILLFGTRWNIQWTERGVLGMDRNFASVQEIARCYVDCDF